LWSASITAKGENKMSKTADNILEILAAGPTDSDTLSAALRVGRTNINSHMRQLRSAGKVRKYSKPRPDKGRNTGYMYELAVKPTFVPAPAPIPAASTPTSVHNLDVAFELLVDAILGRLVTDLSAKIENLLVEQAGRLSGKPARAQIDAPVPKPQLRKIMIGGLLPEQAELIQREFSDRYKIKFVGTTENPSMWKSNAATAEATFVMAGFVSHHHTEAVNSVHGNIQLVHGGMTTLRTSLTNYFAS
jgi:hypothetical protein